MPHPHHIIVIPYYKNINGVFLYAAFLCNGDVYSAPITGGGEEGETPIQSAMCEVYEETGVVQNKNTYTKLESFCTLPSEWLGVEGMFMIPEYAVAVKMKTQDIVLSHEHSAVEWLPYEEAMKRYRYDAHKAALWELHHKLKTGVIK